MSANSIIPSKYPYIESFINDSISFADSVLGPASPSGQAGPTAKKMKIVHHHHHHNSWGYTPFWGSYHHPVYVHSPSCDSSERSDKKKGNALAALPVFLIALATLFPLAQNWAEWTRAERNIFTFRAAHQNAQQEIRDEFAEYPQAQKQLSHAVRNVFHREVALIEHQQAEAKAGFFWKAAFFSSAIGGAAFIAGIAAAPAIGIASAAGAAVSAGAMIWRTGIRSIDDQNPIKAQEIENAALYAQATLSHIEKDLAKGRLAGIEENAPKSNVQIG